MRRHVLAMAYFLVTGPAVADICVYLDKDGNKLYSSVAPEKGWTKLSCAAGDETPSKPVKPDMREWSRWYDARTKIKLGMDEAQVRNADPLLRHADRRRTYESVGSKDEWLVYRYFEVRLHNGRVDLIQY